VQNEQGDYYESHDIGNVLLMLPAAATASTLSDGPTQEQIESPPILVKFGVAMTYATLSAIGCFFVFMLFSLFYPLEFRSHSALPSPPRPLSGPTRNPVGT